MAKNTNIFVNLLVKDLNESVGFFTKLGFKFKIFTTKKIADATKSTEVIMALSADTKAEVNEMVQKALEAGGKTLNEPNDQGWMYGWSFQDLDGHLWEIICMDPSVVNQG